ncbi:MAG: hypothetical protein ISR99_01605 [Parcubacteria group bacterium]|nr:hypothetical protein [Parcubacteria group bacterium]
MSINRHKLTEIIEAESGKNWWEPEIFGSVVRPQLPDELEVILSPPRYEDNYNCFVYAFELESDEEFLGGSNPVQQEFVKWLIVENVLKETNNPEVGNLVFYKNEQGDITHGGIMQDEDTVVSKWMWGPIIRHKLFDVPASFGDNVFF